MSISNTATIYFPIQVVYTVAKQQVAKEADTFATGGKAVRHFCYRWQSGQALLLQVAKRTGTFATGAKRTGTFATGAKRTGTFATLRDEDCEQHEKGNR